MSTKSFCTASACCNKGNFLRETTGATFQKRPTADRFYAGICFQQMIEKDLVPPAIHDGVVAGEQHAKLRRGAEKNHNPEQRRFKVGGIEKIGPVSLNLCCNVVLLSGIIQMGYIF